VIERELIDYRETDFAEAVSGVNAVPAVIGGDYPRACKICRRAASWSRPCRTQCGIKPRLAQRVNRWFPASTQGNVKITFCNSGYSG
jgi:hypothetical protein